MLDLPPLPAFVAPVDPEHRLAVHLPHVRVLIHPNTPGARRGVANFVRQTISLRDGMGWALRRCVILHECLHLERGTVPRGLAAKEEQRVRRLTAQLLLPDVRAIGDAYAWAQGDDEGAAAELGVHVDVLRTRLRTMRHPAERAYLVTRFEEIWEWVQ